MAPPADSTSTTEPPTVVANFRLPAFSTIDSTIWFKRAEVQFRIKKITSSTSQADHVLAAIPDALFPQISKWMDSKGSSAIQYEDLKKYLLKKFSLTPEQRVKSIFELYRRPLGDQRPSDALDQLRALARLPNDSSDTPRTIDLLVALWLTRLPESVRAAITDFTALSDDEIALKADQHFDAQDASATSSLAASANPPADTLDDTPPEAIAIASSSTPRRPRPSTQPSNKAPTPARKADFTSSLCFYHAKFGPKAKKCQAPCAWPSSSQPSIATIEATSSKNDVFFLKDSHSNTQYLVDTGACRSLLPKSMAHPGARCSDVHLIAANGSPIQTYGSQHVVIATANKQYPWEFIIADVSLPLIGADFLAHYHLMVDVAHRRLVDTQNLSCSVMTVAPSELALHVQDTTHPYASLRDEFQSVFRPELRPAPQAKPPHGVYHFITTTGPPVFSKFRRLAPDRFVAARKVFQEMEKIGICQKSSSPWSSPLHLVQKKDGSLRPCGDYRRLNMITEPDHYPLPNIADITSFLHGAKIFSTLDLLKGYFQVPMNPADIPKTAITTPFGTYTFNFSCFGLRNAGATFQRMMDDLLGDLPFCVAYIDDILIFSSSPEEHLLHLRTVLQRLQDAGLVLRHDKCTFGAKEVDFLGHRLSAKGVLPLPSKVSAVKSFPVPTTVKALQEFIGMINYYHRFVPNLASIMTPLYEVLKGKPKSLTWGPPQESAFCASKDALAAATFLQFPAPGAPLSLSTDASDTAMGAVLEQTINGHPQPLAFFSRKLSPAESKYSTFDRELLAAYSSVRHFRHFLQGTSFTLQTDHLPLVHAFSKKSDSISARQQRHLSSISEYNCTLRHVPGKKNPVADALSRNSISTICTGIDYKILARLQQEERDSTDLQNSESSLQFQPISIDDSGITILCDVSTGRPRPWVPPSFRRQVFDAVHGIAHPSARSTTKLLRQKFIWYGLSKDAKSWSRSCLSCQTSKIHRHTESGVGSFPDAQRRFSHIHVDIVGPLPSSEDHRYLFTIVDRSTRWPEALPLKTADAASCASALLSSWISRFGVPLHITSDRGSSFTSSLWSALTTLIGSTHHLTTAYNPEANGLVERMHRTLKAALMTRCKDASWMSQLPWVLLGLRTTPKDGTDVSAAELVYGDPLVIPSEFFPATSTSPDLVRLRSKVGDLSPFPQTYSDTRKTHVPESLKKASHVFVRIDSHRAPLTPPYSGPYKVLQRNDKALLLLIKGSGDWVSIDRVKPAFLPPDDAPPVRFSRAGRPLVPSKRGAFVQTTTVQN